MSFNARKSLSKELNAKIEIHFQILSSLHFIASDTSWSDLLKEARPSFGQCEKLIRAETDLLCLGKPETAFQGSTIKSDTKESSKSCFYFSLHPGDKPANFLRNWTPKSFRLVNQLEQRPCWGTANLCCTVSFTLFLLLRNDAGSNKLCALTEPE